MTLLELSLLVSRPMSKTICWEVYPDIFLASQMWLTSFALLPGPCFRPISLCVLSNTIPTSTQPEIAWSSLTPPILPHSLLIGHHIEGIVPSLALFQAFISHLLATINHVFVFLALLLVPPLPRPPYALKVTFSEDKQEPITVLCKTCQWPPQPLQWNPYSLGFCLQCFLLLPASCLQPPELFVIL